MSDNTAILAGYTVEYLASGGDYEIHVFAKPDADLDGCVRVYDADECEFIILNGWMWSFDPVDD